MLISILGMDFDFPQLMMAISGFLAAIMIAIVFHEWAHAWAAYKSGDPTAKMMKRMTLNPARHLEPMGMLAFLLIGIGWAKPVPVNPFNYRNFRRGNFFVSIAGVTVNFIIGFVASLGFVLIETYGNLGNIWVWGIGMFFMFTMIINISLMIFNLLPIPPLDGYNLLVSFTKPNNRYMRWARENAMFLLLAVLLISMFTGAIAGLRNVIVDGFTAFWGLFFGN